MTQAFTLYLATPIPIPSPPPFGCKPCIPLLVSLSAPWCPLSPLLQLSLLTHRINVSNFSPPLPFIIPTSTLTPLSNPTHPPTTIINFKFLVVRPLHLHCCIVLNHINRTFELDVDNPELRPTDIRIFGWIYTTIGGSLLDLAMSSDGTVLSACTRLHQYFLNNHATHAIHLNRKYRMLMQGTMWVAEHA